jgi:hypothetical protein
MFPIFLRKKYPVALTGSLPRWPSFQSLYLGVSPATNTEGM